MSERVQQAMFANREGRLIEEQQESLRSLLRRQTMASWVDGARLPIFVGLMMIYFIVIPPLGDPLGPLILVVIVLALVAAVLAVRLSIRVLSMLVMQMLNNPRAEDWLRRHLASYDRACRLIERGEVEILKGKLTQENDGEHLHLLFNGQPLDDVFSAAIGNLFISPGGEYILYRVKGSLWLVNMEVVKPGQGESEGG